MIVKSCEQMAFRRFSSRKQSSWSHQGELPPTAFTKIYRREKPWRVKHWRVAEFPNPDALAPAPMRLSLYFAPDRPRRVIRDVNLCQACSCGHDAGAREA
jgi:hypothetical protein